MAVLAERLANYAASLKYEELDEATVQEVRRRVIDSLACALGAYRAEAPVIARKLAATVTGDPGAKYLGGGNHRTSPEQAAFVNGVLFRYLDYNDTYLSLEPAHPSDNLAAIFAAAQAAGASGKDIITAAVIAYEIQCRLCDAASIRSRGWDHVTYGAFSAAAAVGRLLRLKPERLVHALNLSGTPNITLRQTRAGELSQWKGCAFANASRNAVFAARLAAEGLTGPAPIFEGEMGFFKQVSGEFELPALGGETDRTAGAFMIKKTSIKFWPAEYHSQSAIHAALELRPNISDISAIQSIVIESFDAAVDIIGKDPEKWRPKTRETADHSLPYCTAVALMEGDVTLGSFDEAHLNDKKLLSLVSKVEVKRNDKLTARYPKGIPNRITVKMKDGSQLTAENEFPRGHDQNPMTDLELTEKFNRLAQGVLDPGQAEAILECCWQLEKQDSLDRLLSQFPVA
jgi:2-methylcitrate dehydratase